MNLFRTFFGLDNEAVNREAIAEARVEESKRNFGFFAALFIIFGTLFASQTVNAQKKDFTPPTQKITVEQFANQLKPLIGKDFNGVKYILVVPKKETNTLELVMQYTMVFPDTGTTIEQNSEVFKDILIYQFKNPYVAPTLIDNKINIRIVVVDMEGEMLADVTINYYELK